MAKIGAAIAGTGFMGWVHAEALRRAGVDLVGIVGINEADSMEAAARLGAKKAYKSYEELLADPDVTSVHIGTPNNLHCPMARQALEAGKHVLCEKPLALTSAEGAELIATAKARPELVAAVNYNMRFYPLATEARERVRTGAIGDVFHVTGSYVQDWLLYQTDFNWRVVSAEGGATRAVADIGTHWMDMVQFVLGRKITAVCAELQTVHPTRLKPTGKAETFTGKDGAPPAGEAVPIGTEDAGFILLRFDGGVRGMLHVSQVTAGRKNCLRMEVAGSKHALHWNSELPNELWFGARGAANQSLLRDPSLLSGPAAANAAYPGGHNEGYADAFKHAFKAFYGYIGAGDLKAPRPFATFEDGRRELLLCEAILASSKSGAWVEVTD
ncbi:MAG: Gfo/Idh/MocA family protein [Lacipirellulaceae bacterium]